MSALRLDLRRYHYRRLPRTQADVASAHRLNRFGLDFNEDAILARLAERVVLAEIFVGQLVDVCVGTILSHFSHRTANLNVPIRISGIHYGQGVFATLFQGSGLDAPCRGIDPDPVASRIE